MFVDDAAEVLLKSANSPQLFGGIYFATHKEHLTVSEIAHKIVEVFKSGTVVTTEWPEGRRRIEVDSVRFSSAKLHEMTGWEPDYSFDQGLRKTKEVMEAAGAL
jgi:nucleoside-diphosphate-sugar epimerase